MTGVQEANGANGGRGYYLSAGLVNKLIVSIFASILAIAGYMIVWAINDASVRALQEARLATVEGHILDHPDIRNDFQGQITDNTLEIGVMKVHLINLVATVEKNSEKLDRLLERQE